METASRQLRAKFDGARALLERAPAAGAAADRIRTLTNELAALELKFAMSTSHLHWQAAAGADGAANVATEFARHIAAEDYAGDVDRLVAAAEGALRHAGVGLREAAAPATPAGRRATAAKAKGAAAPSAARRVAPAVTAEIQRALDAYPRGGRPPAAGAANDYVWCGACDVEMLVDAARSVLCCGGCGALRELEGTVFDDSQFYSQEGQKAKSGTFNPNRHFVHWWTHILAREPEEEIGDKDDPDNLYGEKLIARLSKLIVRDRKVLRLITVYDCRKMLAEIGRADLNKNAPLIMKKLTGAGPPQLSEAIAVRTENIFTKAIEIGERVRRAGRVNRNYYPFYIGRILEVLIPESDYENRRVLYYIYMQSKETVEADDEDWELICEELAEVDYRPTDRALGLRYPPV
jgi:hypothetical protein